MSTRKHAISPLAGGKLAPEPEALSYGAKQLVREVIDLRNAVTIERDARGAIEARVIALQEQIVQQREDIAVLRAQVRSLQVALPRGIGNVPAVRETPTERPVAEMDVFAEPHIASGE